MSIYDSSTLGTITNKIEFNLNTIFPVYRVVSRRSQQRQIRDLDIPVPFESGVSDFQTLEGKSAYVIDGIMYPGGESQYDSGLAALRKLSSLEVAQEDSDSDGGYVPYVFTEFNQTKQIFMKVLYVDVPESTRKGLVQPFRLVCKVKDPTIFGTTAKVADTSLSDPTTATGTAIFPFSYPIVYGASTYSVSRIASNVGDLPVYPTQIVIRGPVNVPRVTNGLTGEYIEVNVNLNTTSNFLRIIYDKDTLSVEQDGLSVLADVSDNTTYFKIQPGDNTITLTGSSIGSGAYCQLTYFDGWPLS